MQKWQKQQKLIYQQPFENKIQEIIRKAVGIISNCREDNLYVRIDLTNKRKLLLVDVFLTTYTEPKV